MTMISQKTQRPLLGKEELISRVANRAGVNLDVSRHVIEAFTAVVSEGISSGHDVRLYGFGTWEVRKKAKRRVKSIRDQQPITIPARDRVCFSVGATLAQAVGGHSTGKA